MHRFKTDAEVAAETAYERSRLRLDIATRILAADIAYQGLPESIGMPDAIGMADLMIRGNDEFDRAPRPGAAVDIVPSTVRERILDVAHELRKTGGDFQIPRVIRAFNALRIAAGISNEEIDAFDGED